MPSFPSILLSWVVILGSSGGQADAQEPFSDLRFGQLGGVSYDSFVQPTQIAVSDPSRELVLLLLENEAAKAAQQAADRLSNFAEAFLADSPQDRQPFFQGQSFIQAVRAYQLEPAVLNLLKSGTLEERVRKAAVAEM
ncbi:MAG: hypothetical protein AAF514_23920, partial [Verrucomicrobiota bacterium]